MDTKPVIKIPVSMLAAAIGMNKYCSVDEAIADIWNKNNKIQLSSVIKKSIQTKTDDEVNKIFNSLDIPCDKAVEISKSSKMFMIERHCRDQLLEIEKNSKSTIDTQKQIKRKFQDVDLDLAKGVQSVSQMNSGVKHEKSIIDDFELGSLLKVVQRNNKIYRYKIELPSLKYDILLSGKIDGLIEGDDGPVKIVEVKTRRNRLFRTIPLYEKVQCHVYMKMCNVSKCTHIESYNGLSRVSELDFDQSFWDEILKNLIKFADLYSLHNV